jgi:5-methylcytosine-specific restriction endonuclease McrA
MTEPKLGHIAKSILMLLKEHPEGLDIEQIREKLQLKTVQQHLDKRVRELYHFFHIERKKEGRLTKYIYRGDKPESEWTFEAISKSLLAKVMHKAGGRCQMCGKTIQEDNIKLHADHKVPQSWGGKSTEENLWGICSICNEGKKNYFASFDDKLMTKIMSKKSVHARIAELLKLKKGNWVESDLIEFVANATEYQDDWQKRLRELRYLGLKIESSRKKLNNRIISQYKLTNWVELPENPSAAARAYEKKRAIQNSSKK